MCMLIHIQKCPVTLIINPVPLLVCKEIDSYRSYSHTLHMNAYSCVRVCVCVCSSMDSDNYRCVCRPAATLASTLADLIGLIKRWEVGDVSRT